MQMNVVNTLNGFHGSANIDMRVGTNSLRGQLRTNSANAESVFGPQCRVTISREGRKLSSEMKAAEPKRVTSTGMERLLLRQQRLNEMDKSEQADTINEISDLISDIKNSYTAGEDKKTIAEKQDALNRLLDLKARQEAENRQREKDAAGGAAGAAKEQEEIDRKNADLYLMLKTFEEKDEEEGAGDTGAKSDTADTDEGQGSVGDQFQESASMLGVSAAKRELQAKGVIDDMYDSGYGRLAEADAMMREIQAELDLAAESSGRENLSEDERSQLVSEHIGRSIDMMVAHYGEIADLRRQGYQAIQDARELELRHIGASPLDGVDRAKQAIMDAGAAAALHEVSQGALDKASEELEERVQEALDRRDDVVSGSGGDEEQKKAEELAEEKNAEKLEEKEPEEEAPEKNGI